MDNLRFMIAQGSTPTLELGFPFEITDGCFVIVSIWQNRQIALEYDSDDSELVVDATDKSIVRITMPEADTFSLAVGDVEIQVRAKTADGIDTFLPIPGAIVPSYNKEELTDE